LLILAIAVHAPGLTQAFVEDDGLLIWRNPAVTDGAPLASYVFDRGTTSTHDDYNRLAWRPLRTMAFRLVARVGGVRPVAFKLVNLILFAVAALLVMPLVGPWWAALWVVLPVHVEPVTYASALGDQLSLVCELAAILLALRRRNLASTMLFVAALLAKEMAVTTPLLILLVSKLEWRRRWRLPALHAALVGGYLLLRTHILGGVAHEAITPERVLKGALEAPWLLLRYLEITVMPLGHAASYGGSPSGQALAAAAVAVVALALFAWRFRMIGLAWFAIALLPLLQLVPIYVDVADRFALVPSVGLVIALSAWKPKRLAVGCAIALYGAASVIELGAWKNDAILWRECVERQPEARLGRKNLAMVYLRQGRLEEAAAELDALRALGWTRPDLELTRAYLGWRLGRAIAFSPQSGPAHALAGQMALANPIDREAAARELELAGQLAPNHPSVGLLGYRLQGVDDERVRYLEALVALGFDDAAGAVAAASRCSSRPQCEAALGQALLLDGRASDENRAPCERAMAALPSSSLDHQRCRQALWGASGR
jgi:hypothetical protein